MRLFWILLFIISLSLNQAAAQGPKPETGEQKAAEEVRFNSAVEAPAQKAPVEEKAAEQPAPRSRTIQLNLRPASPLGHQRGPSEPIRPQGLGIPQQGPGRFRHRTDLRHFRGTPVHDTDGLGLQPGFRVEHRSSVHRGGRHLLALSAGHRVCSAERVPQRSPHGQTYQHDFRRNGLAVVLRMHRQSGPECLFAAAIHQSGSACRA